MKLSATTICVGWCMMMVVVVAPSLALAEDEEIGKKLGYTTVTFELNKGVGAYSSFLTRMRNAVEAPTRACGLQSTRSTPLSGSEYIYVDLKTSDTQWVTLGIDVKDLYVWGYQDNVKYDRSYRANFLDDAPKAARDNLFRGSKIRNTTFGGDYTSLERASHKTRLTLTLGIENLRGGIENVYNIEESELNKGTGEAKFFLIAIQMVVEAARFKFMEEAIVRNATTTEFKKKMVAFQNAWDNISSAIHKAEAAKQNKCTTITPTLVISKVGLYRLEVNRVDEIKNDMSLLKYEKI